MDFFIDEIPLRLGGKSGGVEQTAPTLIQMDPPAHSRHRKLVMNAFTRRRIAELDPLDAERTCRRGR